LDYWKGTLQERIERFGKAKRRSKEEAAQLKRDKATLKQLQAFDGWTYQAFVEAMLPGRKPDPRDLDNLRLYRLSNGQLIPITNLGRDQLRVDFWRRLLSLWDGPVDKRAELVRGFLDHHHLTGGKAEVFRDLVKDTAARLRGLVSKGASLRDAERWGLLADKLEGWLSDAAERLTATLSRPAPYVFVTGAGGEQWSKEAHLPIMEQRQGPLEPVTASMEQLSAYVNTYYLGPLGGMPPLAVTPFGTAWDGGKPMDLPNPFRIADNWKGTGKPALLCEVPPSEVGPALMWQFREEVLQRWNGSLGADPSLRRQLVRNCLDHHATNGGRGSAFVEVVEALFLSDAPPAPRDVAERIAKGEPTSTVPDGLKAEVRAWMEERRKAVDAASKDMDPNAWPDLKSLALFHAYRVEGADTSADINPSNAQQVAQAAGFTAKSSGKELLAHFRRYAWGEPENKRIERTKEGKRPGDVAKRFHAVLPRLDAYPQGLAVAQAEHPIVRTRSNGSED
jgi:hypothetical protein